MATVTQPAPISNGTHIPEGDQHTEHGPPRFTAVNVKETTSHSSSVPASASSSTQIQEATDLVRVNGNANSSRQDESQRETLNAGTEQTNEKDLQESPLQTTPNGANKNKRKRSESVERQAQQDQPRSGGDIQAIPRRSSEVNSELSMQSIQSMQPEAGNGAKSLSTGQEYPGQPSTSYSHPETKDNQAMNGTNGSWQDYDSHLISQAQKAQSLDTSDAQLAEALQRETNSAGSIEQRSWVTTPQASVSGEVDPRSVSSYSQEKSQSGVQVGPKRKRVFSNRTKTGCLTCRRRKKKCDEQHPACNNCIRGGFVCEGYSSRSTWQKPSSSKGPVPLQSKEGYSEVASQYLQDVSSRHHERVPTTTQQAEVSKVRPVVVEDNDGNGTQYLGSANVGNNRNSWAKRSWPSTTHPPYMAEHMAKSDYREVPPIHELSREGQTKAEYHVVPSIRELSQQGSHSKPAMPIFQGPVDQRPPHPNAMDTTSPQAQARLALSIEHQLSTRHNTGEDTERDKMIHGELYRPFDLQLVEDRDRCKSALWRFNNACNPQSGVSSKEQNRLLREVIMPPVTTTSPSGSPATSRPVGSISQGAVVEAPFRCHYGFNIHIGEDVMISENCSMIDDCPIHIGAHTWIGPNVTILGSMAHANMQERKGSQSRYQGRSVTIEEDCYVGANCTIYPGVRLRRGAYVAPGEVVKSDIVAYGFQGLKPSYM